MSIRASTIKSLFIEESPYKRAVTHMHCYSSLIDGYDIRISERVLGFKNVYRMCTVYNYLHVCHDFFDKSWRYKHVNKTWKLNKEMFNEYFLCP